MSSTSTPIRSVMLEAVKELERLRAAAKPVADDELEAIRGRHNSEKKAYTNGYFSHIDGKRAHADRAILLRALDEERTRVAELEEALSEMLKCAGFVKQAKDLDDYEIRAVQLVRLVENRSTRLLAKETP